MPLSERERARPIGRPIADDAIHAGDMLLIAYVRDEEGEVNYRALVVKTSVDDHPDQSVDADAVHVFPEVVKDALVSDELYGVHRDLYARATGRGDTEFPDAVLMPGEWENSIELDAMTRSKARRDELRAIAIYEAIKLLQEALKREPGLSSAIGNAGLDVSVFDGSAEREQLDLWDVFPERDLPTAESPGPRANILEITNITTQQEYRVEGNVVLIKRPSESEQPDTAESSQEEG